MCKDSAGFISTAMLCFCSARNGTCFTLWEGSGRETGDNTGYAGFHITRSQAVHPNVWQKDACNWQETEYVIMTSCPAGERERSVLKMFANQWSKIKVAGSGESHSNHLVFDVLLCLEIIHFTKMVAIHFSFYGQTSFGLNIERLELIEFKFSNFFYKFHLLNIVVHTWKG